MKHISWKEIDEGIKILVEKIGSERFDSIYAFPRGGLVLGVMLSHRLNIPLTLEIQPGSLLVDDIADSGKTLQGFSQKKAVLIYKTGSVVVPDFFATQVPKNSPWFVYPWEVQ